MNLDGFVQQLPDIDPEETAEWLESLEAVIAAQGTSRAQYLLANLLRRARERGVGVPASVTTPYINTIAPQDQPWFPGDEHVERRVRAYIRWNAAAMVIRANHQAEGIGGHLSTFASSAALYEVGFNHFFRGKDDGLSGDQVYFQGHAAPGIYARAYMEGRLDEDDLDHFRREVGRVGLSSYPHPRLMPDFWEFPTVSMGLGPLAALYQARYNRYLLHRKITDTSKSRVWCYIGDGECDEPETLGALSLASRERLDNLIFVVNCNLQRLDGPVRGNGKIIQELEAVFRGAGWNVIKVIWGGGWDSLLAADTHGVLLDKMNSTVDGEFQRMTNASGAYIREHFFGPDPRLRKLVEHLSDEELQYLPRGGHDYEKLYAAYASAVEHEGAPTAILAKTVKGWTLGPDIEAKNATHQIKKMTRDQLLVLRDRLHMTDQIPDDAFVGDDPPYYRPPEGSDEYEYMIERRRTLDGPFPVRSTTTKRPLELPAGEIFKEFDEGSGGQPVSTTMAFTRLLRSMLRDPAFGNRVVPIIPDEARTFGMDSLFREVKIYASQGQKYEPVDHDLLLSYQEATDGQILEEGITEAGAMSSFIAAGTSYATHGTPMAPFYIFYSMFGFQRVGDLAWMAADARARGFLCGATAGRTTLHGEGLQHQDGHSLVLASTIPSCEAYDPAFAYEMAAIVQDGIRRMYRENEDIYYYLTLYNENYEQPATPDNVDLGPGGDLLRGLYKWADAPKAKHPTTVLFSGSAQGEARRAVDELAEHFDVGAELWSATSYKKLREDALDTERQNRLHPSGKTQTAFVQTQLEQSSGPIVAVTDFMKAVPDQIARWAPRRFVSLGTDGMGMSDTREALRRHFEIDAGHIVVATLAALAADGSVKPKVVAEAISRYDIDPESVNPRTIV